MTSSTRGNVAAMQRASVTTSVSKRKQPTSREELARIGNDQASFLILTRDNYQPDPSGTHSTTYGPLPWAEVAKKFTEVYGDKLSTSAAEKRVRQHRATWMRDHPEHPRPGQIVYAENPSTEARAKLNAEKHQVQQIAIGDDKADRVDEVIITKANHFEYYDDPLPLRRALGGRVPPNNLRKRADIQNYFDDEPVPTYAQGKWVNIGLENENGSIYHVSVHTKDIRQTSSFVARELQSRSNLEIEIGGTSRTVIVLYIMCISPVKLTMLPAYGPNDTPIEWTMKLLMDLYALAAQLEDQHVQKLVIRKWKVLFQQDIQLEVDLCDLEALFISTEPEDDGRAFWVTMLHRHGLAQQVIDSGDCHEDLLISLEKLKFQNTL